eukprot:6195998-Pleurochrysis_carterae.AAC.3
MAAEERLVLAGARTHSSSVTRLLHQPSASAHKGTPARLLEVEPPRLGVVPALLPALAQLGGEVDEQLFNAERMRPRRRQRRRLEVAPDHRLRAKVAQLELCKLPDVCEGRRDAQHETLELMQCQHVPRGHDSRHRRVRLAHHPFRGKAQTQHFWRERALVPKLLS